jgi:hypothetical protein
MPEVANPAHPLDALVAAGLASAPTGDGSWRPPSKHIRLSRPLDEILQDVSSGAEQLVY